MTSTGYNGVEARSETAHMPSASASSALTVSAVEAMKDADTVEPGTSSVSRHSPYVVAGIVVVAVLSHCRCYYDVSAQALGSCLLSPFCFGDCGKE